MNIARTFQTIDSHTSGEPTRLVVGGMTVIPGNTMMERYDYMRKNCDWMRRALALEPRGNSVTAGAFLTPPVSSEADFGVLYFETGDWQTMCGHATIGVATSLVETGMVEKREPYTEISLDTPIGIVKTRVKIENGRATEVAFQNVPAFVVDRDVEIATPEFGKVRFDLAFGGNIYAVLPAEQLGLTITPDRSREIVSKLAQLRQRINEQIKVHHPALDFVEDVAHIEIYEPSDTPGVDCRNTVLITGTGLDRSPCGTGTSARLALLRDRNQIAVGQDFVQESIIGGIFTGRIVGETAVSGGTPAIIPEIRGRAFLTGMSTVLIDEEDPLYKGFELN